MKTGTAPAVAEFRRAMEAHGLACSDAVVGDGRIHRFHVKGDSPDSKNGYYILHDDESPAGVFGSWKTGEKITWSAKSESNLSPAEREKLKARIQALKTRAEVERKRLNDEAAMRARDIWEKSQPVTAHPYLEKKQVQAHGARAYEDQLVIPACGPGGQIATLQFIDQDGKKKFLRDGAKRGNYFTIGKPSGTIYIGEGFATMATIHAVTGEYVAVAFDCGNLLPVAERIKAEYPGSKIVFCADNDIVTEGNPGLTKAREAAAAVGAAVVFPAFGQSSSNGKPPTDFNDLRLLEGAEAVLSQLQSIEKPELTLKDAILNYACLMSLKLPERERIFPWLPVGGIVMAYGPRGIGKTFLDLAMAVSLCTGTPFLRWESPQPTGVLHVDGEMDLDDLRGRVTALLPEPPKAPLVFLTSQHVYRTLEKDLILTDPDVRQEITKILDDRPELRVLIIDNISCLFSGIDEDRKKDWEPIAAWLIRLRHRGISIILVHHAGKGGQQRGTSGREDSLDTVIQLKKPAGYEQQEGCHFELSFEKCRSAKGDTLEPIDVKLTECDGKLTWAWMTLSLSKEEQASRLFEEGVTSPSDMAEELGITKGYASKLIRKIKNKKKDEV